MERKRHSSEEDFVKAEAAIIAVSALALFALLRLFI
jgi:hypothetical protein